MANVVTPTSEFHYMNFNFLARSDLRVPGEQELRPVYVKLSNGSYMKIDHENLIQELMFTETNALYFLHDRSRGGVKLLECKFQEVGKKIGEVLFMKIGNNMHPLIPQSKNANFRGPVLKDPCNWYNHFMVLTNGKSFTTERATFEVNDGVIQENHKVELLRKFAYDYEREVFMLDGTRYVYGDKNCAMFFTAATIVGENNKPWSDYVCFNDEEKKKLGAAIKQFRDSLKELGATMMYDQDGGKLRFFKNSDNLPMGYRYEDDNVDVPDTETKIQLPEAAFFDPEGGFSCDENTECWRTFVVFDKALFNRMKEEQEKEKNMVPIK
jgi:hypothetical protein